MNKKALLLIASGVEECEALIARDILLRSGINVDMINMNEEDSSLEVVSSHRLVFLTDTFFYEDEYDVLIIPGGKAGTLNLDKNETLDEIIESFYKEKKLIAAICAAPSLLGKRGYLKNEKYTCYPGWQKEEYGTYTGNEVEESGNFITGRSMYYTSEFALRIIRRLLGEGKEAEIRNQIQGIK